MSKTRSLLLATIGLAGLVGAHSRLKINGEGALIGWRDDTTCIPSGQAWFGSAMGDDTVTTVLSLLRDDDTVTVRSRLSNGCVQQHRYIDSSDTDLRLSWWLTCPQTTEFPDGLSLRMPTHAGDARQFSEEGVWRKAETFQSESVFQLASRVDFPGGIQVAVPNRFHSFWSVDTLQGQQRFEVLPVWRENLNVPKGTASTQRLVGGDTLFRWLEVRRDTTAPPMLSFSEHPWGRAHSLIMYFDDLPNRDGWEVISDSMFPRRYNSQIVGVLERHPEARIGWVLVLDRSAWQRLAPTLSGWSVPRPWVLLDTLDPLAGATQILAWAPTGDSAVVSSSTHFRATAGETIGLSGLFRGLGKAVDATVRVFRLDSTQARDSSGRDTTLWRRVLVGERTVAIPFSGDLSWSDSVVVDSTTKWLQLSLRVPPADRPVAVDNLFLRRGSLILNGSGSFLGSVASSIVADTTRYAWTDFHGPEHILSRATSTYKAFLKNLVRSQGREGWESQVYVGIHGYHHDPGFHEPDPYHEFSHADTAEQRRIMDRLYGELRSLGLYPYAAHFVRSPGYEYLGSTLDAFADSGVVFMDPGIYGRIASGNEWAPIYQVLRRDGREMWGVSDTWWSDYWPTSRGLIPRAVDTAMTRMRTTVLGGHPEQTFLDTTTWVAYDSLLTAWASRYPGTGWPTPYEWAANARSTASLEVRNSWIDAGGRHHLRFRGACDSGVSLVLRMGGGARKGASATVDGSTLTVFAWQDGFLHTALPALEAGDHEVVFDPGTETAASLGESEVRAPATGTRTLDLMGRRRDAGSRGLTLECPESGTGACRLHLQLK